MRDLSFMQFFSMGGYAKYVWSSYGLALLVLLGNGFWSWRMGRRVKRLLKKNLAMKDSHHASRS